MPLMFVTREMCLSQAYSNVLAFNRSCEEYMLYCRTISCAESMAIFSELMNKFARISCISVSQKKLYMKISNTSDPVTLDYETIKSPRCGSNAQRSLLWLSPFVALCVQPKLISIVYMFNDSQVEYCIEYPLIVWPDMKIYGRGHKDGLVPMDVPDWTPVKCSKICHVQNIKFFTYFRNQCDFSVHLDTCSYFVGSPVRFEFQTILDMSYEICKCLRTLDMVELLKLVAGSLDAMLRVGLPQVTLFGLFSPGRKGLEDRYESPEMTSENANEQVQANFNSNDMMLQQGVTPTILEKTSDEVRTASPETMKEMIAHIRHKFQIAI